MAKKAKKSKTIVVRPDEADRQAEAAKTSRLRALRLAKDAADRDAASRQAAANAAAPARSGAVDLPLGPQTQLIRILHTARHRIRHQVVHSRRDDLVTPKEHCFGNTP